MWVKAAEKPISACLRKCFPWPEPSSGPGCLSAATGGWRPGSSWGLDRTGPLCTHGNPHSLPHSCEVFFLVGQELWDNSRVVLTTLLDCDVGSIKANNSAHTAIALWVPSSSTLGALPSCRRKTLVSSLSYIKREFTKGRLTDISHLKQPQSSSWVHTT